MLVKRNRVCRGRSPAFTLCSATAVVIALTACRPDPVTLYVTSGFTDQIVRIDAATGRILDSIPIDPRKHEIDEPHAVAASPTGTHWYATVAHGESSLWKYERPGDRLVGMLPLGSAGAARIGITPDGRRGFIPDYFRSGGPVPGEVVVVSLDDLVILDRLSLCVAPHDAAVHPNGRVVAIVCSGSDEIVLVDATSLAEMTRFPVGAEENARPLNAVWIAESDELVVTLQGADVVRAFHADGSVSRTMPVGDAPTQLAASPPGSWLAVANRGENTTSIIDLADGTERHRVPIPAASPHGVTIGPAGRTAYVTSEGDVSSPGAVTAVDLETGTVLWSTPAGAVTFGVIALSADDIGPSVTADRRRRQ